MSVLDPDERQREFEEEVRYLKALNTELRTINLGLDERCELIQSRLDNYVEVAEALKTIFREFNKMRKIT